MKLVALIRPAATVTVEGAGVGVEELRTAVLDQAPADHELAQLLVGSGRVDGNLIGTGTFQSTITETVEVEAPDYATARTALSPLVPDGYQVLSYRTFG